MSFFQKGFNMSIAEGKAPLTPAKVAVTRRKLAPDSFKAFREFTNNVFSEGELPSATKQLIAVAVAHTTQCPVCIKSHTRDALAQGASAEQIMEAIWVAAAMRAGGANAYSAVAIEEILESQGHRSNEE